MNEKHETNFRSKNSFIFANKGISSNPVAHIINIKIKYLMNPCFYRIYLIN
jgi:hypothetical protein